MKAALTAFFFTAGTALAAPLGDDGLHKPDWLQESFLDLGEDLAEARAAGKHLLISVEQRGCIYCAKMHAEIFPAPEIDRRLRSQFQVVQINLHGALEVTDLDGSAASEKAIAAAWAVNFTPTLLFLPLEPAEGLTAREAAVAALPGAPEVPAMEAVMDWVVAGGEVTGLSLKDVLKSVK